MHLATLALTAAALLASFDVAAAGPRTTNAQTQRYVRGQVYINGVLLSEQQKALMAEIIQEEFMPAGRWYVTDEGMLGLEGQAPIGSLIPYVQAYLKRHKQPQRGRGGGGEQHNSRTGTGGIQNGCAWISTPMGSVFSGNCG
jgi:hypothetical protein